MFAQAVCQIKTARLPDCYCFPGGSIHDCRDSQPSSGWLRKVGVLDFCQIRTARLPDCYCFPGVSIHDCRDSQPNNSWLTKVGFLNKLSSRVTETLVMIL